MRINAAIEAQYFPPIEFFALYKEFDQLYLLEKERFEKQSYRSRCRILASNKVQDLIVPVQKGKTQLISGEVQVIYQQNWWVLHERAIASSYGRAPYFDHYFPQIVQILHSKPKTIFELNVQAIRWAEKALELKEASIWNEDPIPSDIQNLRSAIHPKNNPSVDRGPSTVGYTSKQYFQCFDHLGFAPNLSVLDLIMNMGPESTAYLGSIELRSAS